jgi:hypothetical protein
MWIPKQEVMLFLGFADTQMAAISKQYKIVSIKIGKHVYYQTHSLLEAFRSNQIK